MTTPLYDAALDGDAAEVQALLAAGAAPDEGDEDGTPLCAAACWSHTDAVRALLAGGAAPDYAENDLTPLVYAALRLDAATAVALLEAGANPNGEGAPLVRAAGRGALGVVRALLAHGADPALRDADGQTALEAAEAWVGEDVEQALVASLPGDGPVEVTREPLEDGTERIEVVRVEEGAVGELGTGHAQIVALLGNG
ncbi:ankyrin repeat domain-containing protein [Solirubrobacter phytolaccae]|uniref:Ankyrin repeat domain-containing protein n=1 Tax=Solirubrobacter phytolaccae TaxID=1404360 RepID=A0A9X3S736_9ACTN|nr:ankyrin repeat domain-containing protein [Solirubrobacter phytolaccae]MDA0178731.1 ankyrin repeat domain-containing protein [Solirubrobacter phytolaccae]